jgi:hypothetical protein
MWKTPSTTTILLLAITGGLIDLTEFRLTSIKCDFD